MKSKREEGGSVTEREAESSERKEDAMLLFLKMMGPKARECRWFLEAGKGKKPILPKTLEGTSPANILVLVQ